MGWGGGGGLEIRGRGVVEQGRSGWRRGVGVAEPGGGGGGGGGVSAGRG